MDNPKKKKSAVKRVLVEVSIGLVLGFVVWTYIGPTFISWWYKPPSQDAFSCAGTVADALTKFVKFQIGCAAAGGIGLTLLSVFVRRAFGKSKNSAGA